MGECNIDDFLFEIGGDEFFTEIADTGAGIDNKESIWFLAI